jgi:hypothetical protein
MIPRKDVNTRHSSWLDSWTGALIVGWGGCTPVQKCSAGRCLRHGGRGMAALPGGPGLAKALAGGGLGSVAGDCQDHLHPAVRVPAAKVVPRPCGTDRSSHPAGVVVTRSQVCEPEAVINPHERWAAACLTAMPCPPTLHHSMVATAVLHAMHLRCFDPPCALLVACCWYMGVSSELMHEADWFRHGMLFPMIPCLLDAWPRAEACCRTTGALTRGPGVSFR